jgi:hypothetical protein
MKRSYWFKTLVIAFILVSFSCTTPTVQEEKEGGWKGCVIGFYPENGNETLSKGEIYEVDDFEEIIGQKVGSVVWFPTWDDEFPMVACQRLHERGIIPHLTWEIFWPSKDPNNTSQTGQKATLGLTMC